MLQTLWHIIFHLEVKGHHSFAITEAYTITKAYIFHAVAAFGQSSLIPIR